MSFLHKTRAPSFWNRLRHLAPRRARAPSAPAAHRPHVPTFGLLVPPHQDR